MSKANVWTRTDAALTAQPPPAAQRAAGLRRIRLCEVSPRSWSLLRKVDSAFPNLHMGYSKRLCRFHKSAYQLPANRRRAQGFMNLAHGLQSVMLRI
jgi:hypothetical protein